MTELEQEKLLQDIYNLTGKTKKEIIDYVQSNPVSLGEYRDKLFYSLGNIPNDSICFLVAPNEFLSNLRNLEIKPMKLSEKIISIPYKLVYFISKPILWFVYQIWLGIQEAYLDIWDE